MLRCGARLGRRDLVAQVLRVPQQCIVVRLDETEFDDLNENQDEVVVSPSIIMGLSYSCLMEPSCGSPWIRTHAPWLLYYQTPKYIKVDVPEVGVLYYTCVLIAMLVALLPLHFSNAWAMTEVPGGIVNAWSTQGGMPSTTSVRPAALTAPYCAEPWMLQLGQQQQQALPCRLFRPSELTYKTEDAMAFTSALTETRTTGWRCADDGNRTRRTACSTRGGVPFQRQSGQCGCELRQTVFPFAVERMSLSFEHAYVVDGSWRGSSVGALPGEEGLWSELVFANGTRLRFDAGVALQLPLSEWLAAAGISLDAPNPSTRTGPSGVLPNRRSTGASLRVDISYTNLDPYSRRAIIGNRSVHAEVRLSSIVAVDVEVGRQNAVWVGSAALPGGPPSEFDIVDRHRRGVVFKFHVTGQVYAFDFFVLLKVLLSAVVVAGSANLVADVVAFYCLPNGSSTVLRNKRQELVSKRGEFAELGMKAALTALIYRDLDPDNNGAIEPVDICKAFAHAEKSDGTPWVPWEKAHAIAHTVLRDADTDVDAAQGAYGLSFSELATCLHGQSIDFDAFLKNLDQEITKGSRKEADMEKCRRAFEEERAKLPPVLKAVRARGRRPELPPPIQLESTSAAEKHLRLEGRGELRIHLLYADGLKPADTNGSADPYVSAVLGKQRVQSTIKERTLYPVWDETLGPWKVKRLGKLLSQQLELVITDKDMGVLDSDDAMGEVSVSLQALADYERINFSEDVFPQGKIVFSVTWVNAEKKEEVQGKSTSATSATRVATDSALSELRQARLERERLEEGGAEALREVVLDESDGPPSSPDVPGAKKKKKKIKQGPPGTAGDEGRGVEVIPST